MMPTDPPLTGSSGRHATSGPAAAARDGIEAPVRPVLERRGGLRQEAGLIAVAALAITVVAAGLGLFDGGTDDDRGPVAVGPSGSAPAVSPSAASSAATALATTLPGTTCLPVTIGEAPEFRLASDAGEGEPVPGALGRSHRVARSPITSTWPEVAPRLALALDRSASMVVTTAPETCLRSVVAEYVAAGDRADSPPSTILLEIGDATPRPRYDLGSLPDGDWIVRVVAEYASDAAGHDEGAVMERFFRVFVGTGPGASPLIGPAVPCEPLPAGAPAPRLELVADDGEAVLGVDLAVFPSADLPRGATVTGSFPGRLQLRVVGDACATSWLAQFMDGDASRDVLNENAQQNPGENPFLVAQNRMNLPNVILGHSVLEATVNFGREISARAGWDVTITGAPPPTVEVFGSGGAHLTARPGCGVGWTLADGRNAWEACGEPLVPEGAELLRVRSGRAVRLEVAGWTMVSWWVSCGERAPDSTGYLETMGCVLGGGGNGVDDAGPAMFLPFPGRHVVAAWITAKRDGDVVGAQYFMEIEAVP
jgi:hypothetical protein